MTTNARIILDSIGPNGARLVTMELTYHRYVHAELMTHRLLSRNSASSRAIPNAKLVQRIMEDPAIPVVWGTNQTGMQAAQPLEGEEAEQAKRHWLSARRDALHHSKELSDSSGYGLNVHKQIVNRLIEPWMFITVLVTATELDNYFALRVHPKAQPEIEKVSRLALEACASSKPQRLKAGQWHLPLVTGYDEDVLRQHDLSDAHLCRISTGRCARTSYMTHEGKREPVKDLELCNELQKNGHMSPFEHAAQAMTTEEWKKYAEHLACEWINHRIPVGNFWGWRQFRKTIDNEHDFSLLQGTNK